MKTDTVLQCDQCENDKGEFISSELDITDCRKIENIHGKLACTSREAALPPPDDDPTTQTNPPDDDPTTQTNLDDTDGDDKENDYNGLPDGSYKKDCTGCMLKRNGELLACDYCKRNNGVMQYTIAYASGCPFFVNRDGLLRCAKTHS